MRSIFLTRPNLHLSPWGSRRPSTGSFRSVFFGWRSYRHSVLPVLFLHRLEHLWLPGKIARVGRSMMRNSSSGSYLSALQSLWVTSPQMVMAIAIGFGSNYAGQDGKLKWSEVNDSAQCVITLVPLIPCSSPLKSWGSVYLSPNPNTVQWGPYRIPSRPAWIKSRKGNFRKAESHSYQVRVITIIFLDEIISLILCQCWYKWRASRLPRLFNWYPNEPSYREIIW